MTQTWAWRYYDSERRAVKPVLAQQDAAQEFPGQSDAESWLGEHWRELAELGVAEVELTEVGLTEVGLTEADKVHYAMSLAVPEA